MAYLILVRHGQSEWNALGQWTGITDIGLTEQGRADAKAAAEYLRGVKIDRAYTSNLIRTHQTLDEIQKVLGTRLSPTASAALNERDYGDLTGKNKWQVKEEFSEARFQAIRRGWNEPVPGGETLKDVSDRLLPYYKSHIEADVRAGHNVIVSSHGNTLRALIKYLENISDSGVEQVEIEIAQIYIYDIDEDGKVMVKRVLGGTADKPKS